MEASTLVGLSRSSSSRFSRRNDEKSADDAGTRNVARHVGEHSHGRTEFQERRGDSHAIGAAFRVVDRPRPREGSSVLPKDPDLVFYDVGPTTYHGWAGVISEAPKAFANYRSLKLAFGDDLRTHRNGKIAWATSSFHGVLTRKDGGVEPVLCENSAEARSRKNCGLDANVGGLWRRGSAQSR